MNRQSRYVLVCALATSLVVDHSAARCPKVQNACFCNAEAVCCRPAPCSQVEVVNQVEFTDCCQLPSSSHVPGPNACGEAVPSGESSGCSECLSESTSSTLNDRDELEEQLPEVLTPAPAEEESILEEPTPVEAPAEASTNESSPLPVAPIAVPEPTPTVEQPQPAAAEPTASSIVGDRYSSEAEVVEPTPTDAEASNDDVFGESTQPTPAASPQQTPETIVPAPVAAEPTATSNDNLEDLFGPSGTADEAVGQPAEQGEQIEESDDKQPASASESTEEFSDDPFDPFSQSLRNIEKHLVLLSSPGGFNSDHYRTWTDNTESFRCDAKLLRVTAEHVVLIRSTGQRAEVSFSRLSDADLEFVKQQLIAKRQLRSQSSVLGKFAVDLAN